MKEKILDKLIEKRNHRLLRFFEVNKLTPVRIIGDTNAPAIIYQEKMVLSAYVHNFDLHFTDKPHGGEIIKTYKLTAKVLEVRIELLQIIEAFPQRPVYKIRLKEMKNLFLTGYNFMKPDKESPKGKFPVFARHKPKIYFSQDKAEEISYFLSDLGYSVEIV
jgi:hypothetical protein